MRALLLVLVVLAPGAVAQVAPSPVVSVGAIPELKPLAAATEVPVHVQVSCLRVAPGTQPLEVKLWIAEAPGWSRPVVTPASFRLDPMACPGNSASFDATLRIDATEEAPANVPAPVRIAAAVESAQGNSTGVGVTNVTAGFYSILDVSLREAVAIVAPGKAHVYTLNVTNHGNDDVRVMIRPLSKASWMQIDPVEDAAIPSRFHAPSNTREIPLVIHAEASSGIVNHAGNADFEITSVRASDANVPGDQSHVSIVLTDRSPLLSPALSAWWMIGLVVAVVAARRVTLGASNPSPRSRLIEKR